MMEARDGCKCGCNDENLRRAFDSYVKRGPHTVQNFTARRPELRYARPERRDWLDLTKK